MSWFAMLRKGGTLALPCLAVMAAAHFHPAAAQAPGAIEGIVVDQQTAEPIEGAVVTVESRTLEARSGSDGHFLLAGAPAGTLLIRVNAPGYSRLVEEVEVTPGGLVQLEIRLLSVTALLDEVLVTGDRRPGPEVQTRDTGEAQTAADLLSRRIPGLSSGPYGGEIGGRERVLIRGVSSLSLGNEPAIYLDGLRIFSGGDGAQEMAQVIQLLQAIPAEAVTRLEVLRGPSASAEFGELATGVIAIETRGRTPPGGG